MGGEVGLDLAHQLLGKQVLSVGGRGRGFVRGRAMPRWGRPGRSGGGPAAGCRSRGRAFQERFKPPAFIVEHDRGTVITLPGVPREMEYLLVHREIAHLRERCGIQGEIRIRAATMRLGLARRALGVGSSAGGQRG